MRWAPWLRPRRSTWLTASRTSPTHTSSPYRCVSKAVSWGLNGDRGRLRRAVKQTSAKNDFFDGSPKEKDNMLLSLFPFHNCFQIFFVFLYNKYCDNTISTTYKFLIRIRIFDFLPSNMIHNSNTSFLQRILRRM